MLFRMADMLGAIIRYRQQASLVLIDTYSTNAFYFAWASARLCKLIGKSYITILHGGNLPQRIEGSPAMSAQLFTNSVTNVVVSGYLQQHINKLGYKNELIPNNIDLSLYPYRHRAEVQPKLLWVRAFHQTYNPEMAIKVLAGICKQYPNARLTMVGPEKDGSMERCQQLAAESGLAGKVDFTGKLSKNDWINLSSGYDIFINTTDFDNLPVSVIEAMALGFPIVSTNVGGIPYLIKDGHDGLLVEKGDVNAMVSAIARIIDDKKLAADMSSAARAKAETFDWKVIKHKWTGLLHTANQTGIR